MATNTAQKIMFFNTLINDEEVSKQFANWFWEGENGNLLIEKLNSVKNDEIISRESDESYPYIYGVVLNQKIFQNKELKLVKVGLTQRNTAPSTSDAKSPSTSGATASGSKNRMEVVRDRIRQEYKSKAAILFVLRKNPTDTSSSSDCEKSIREKFGILIHKEVTNQLKLPVPTEWVLTTQNRIDLLKGNIKELKKNGTTMHTGNVINALKFEDEIPVRVTLEGPNIKVLVKSLENTFIAEKQDTKGAGKGGGGGGGGDLKERNE